MREISVCRRCENAQEINNLDGPVAGAMRDGVSSMDFVDTCGANVVGSLGTHGLWYGTRFKALARPLRLLRNAVALIPPFLSTRVPAVPWSVSETETTARFVVQVGMIPRRYGNCGGFERHPCVQMIGLIDFELQFFLLVGSCHPRKHVVFDSQCLALSHLACCVVIVMMWMCFRLSKQ